MSGLLFCLVRSFVLPIAGLVFLSPVRAAETVSGSPVTSATYIQAMLALTLIIGLLLGMAWLAKKLNGGKGFGQGGLKVIGGLTLGPRERIFLVEAGGEWLVIGIVPGQIRTLHTLPKGELPQELVENPGSPKFIEWLKAAQENKKNA